MSLADKIKGIREQKNLLQKDVAVHICVDKSTYSKIEKGPREVTMTELLKMAQLFNVTADQLVSYDGNLPKDVVIEDKKRRGADAPHPATRRRRKTNRLPYHR
jgi:transcriptional regulator with XRE-family HTH domain